MLKVSFFNFCTTGHKDTPIVSKFLMETNVGKLAGIISLKINNADVMKCVFIGKQDHNPACRKGAFKCLNSKKSCGGYYCCVPKCKNSTGRNKERSKVGLPTFSFHSFPDITSAKGKAWIKRIRRDPDSNFVVGKSTKICSEHFKDDDFFPNLSQTGERQRLKHEQSHQFSLGTKLINVCR